MLRMFVGRLRFCPIFEVAKMRMYEKNEFLVQKIGENVCL